MTATELYAIVKNHKDVWGDVLEYAECEPPDPPIWCMGVNENIMVDEADAEGEEWKREAVALDDRISEGACPVSLVAVEYALLGLGVKWLVERKAHPGTGYPIGKDGSFSCWVDPKVGCDFWDRRECRGPSILAAIYAAISEVKRETKDPH